MSKKLGCPVGKVRINGKRREKKPMKTISYKELDNNQIQKNKCDKTLEKLEEYLFSKNKDRSSSEFKEIMKSVLKSCSYTPPKYSTMDDIDPPIHVKSLDMIAKHAKVCLRKGTLASGHRGDYIKVRNGHGTYIPFNRKAY